MGRDGVGENNVIPSSYNLTVYSLSNLRSYNDH